MTNEYIDSTDRNPRRQAVQRRLIAALDHIDQVARELHRVHDEEADDEPCNCTVCHDVTGLLYNLDVAYACLSSVTLQRLTPEDVEHILASESEPGPTVPPEPVRPIRFREWL